MTFHCYFFSCFHFYIAYSYSRKTSEISNMKYKHCYISLGMKSFANFVSVFPLILFWLLLCLGSLIIIPAARQDCFSLGLSAFCLRVVISVELAFFHYVVLQPGISLFNLDCIDKDEDFNCICSNKVGSLACVRCLSDCRFENVHILQLSRSNEDVTVNSLFICLPVRKLQEKKDLSLLTFHT